MSDPCDICGGRQVIDFPVRPRTPASIAEAENVDPRSPVVSKKTFPCPQCSPVVDETRVALVHARSVFAREDPAHLPAMRDAMAEEAAQRIARVMLDDGYIQLSWVKCGADENPAMPMPHFELRATAGVVSTATVASMTQRIAEHQDVVARQVVDEAAKLIGIWGSRYHNHTSIAKDDACHLIETALTNVTKRHSRGEG